MNRTKSKLESRKYGPKVGKLIIFSQVGKVVEAFVVRPTVESLVVKTTGGVVVWTNGALVVDRVIEDLVVVPPVALVVAIIKNNQFKIANNEIYN